MITVRRRPRRWSSGVVDVIDSATCIGPGCGKPAPAIRPWCQDCAGNVPASARSAIIHSYNSRTGSKNPRYIAACKRATEEMRRGNAR